MSSPAIATLPRIKGSHSFEPVLDKWLRALRPQRVWEWGPGLSTHLILNGLTADARLVSIEHQEKWLAKIRAEIGADARWSYEMLPATDIASRYAHRILEETGKQDLIFVDGRRRVECVLAALQAVSPQGVIILHDVNRKVYTDLLLPLIEVQERANNTLAFRPRAALLPNPTAAS
jgi:predicted O-methyltransferase YrrM